MNKLQGNKSRYPLSTRKSFVPRRSIQVPVIILVILYEGEAEQTFPQVLLTIDTTLRTLDVCFT